MSEDDLVRYHVTRANMKLLAQEMLMNILFKHGFVSERKANAALARAHDAYLVELDDIDRRFGLVEIAQGYQ